MAHRKEKDILSCLDPQQLAEVLHQILIRHRDLREEANSIASDLLNDISVEAVSKEVTDMILGVGLEVLGKRAGKQPWGYVEPGEAAWEVLEESIEGIQKEMEKRMQAARAFRREALPGDCYRTVQCYGDQVRRYFGLGARLPSRGCFTKRVETVRAVSPEPQRDRCQANYRWGGQTG